jgi:hypothetical protein
MASVWVGVANNKKYNVNKHGCKQEGNVYAPNCSFFLCFVVVVLCVFVCFNAIVTCCYKIVRNDSDVHSGLFKTKQIVQGRGLVGKSIRVCFVWCYGTRMLCWGGVQLVVVLSHALMSKENKWYGKVPKSLVKIRGSSYK